MRDSRWPSGLNLIVGIYLVLASFSLSTGGFDVSRWNTLTVGALVALLAAARLFGRVSDWASWLNVVLGFWLVLSPFMFRYADVGWLAAHDVIVGIVIAVGALLSPFALKWSKGSGRSFASAQPSEEELDRRRQAERDRWR